MGDAFFRGVRGGVVFPLKLFPTVLFCVRGTGEVGARLLRGCFEKRAARGRRGRVIR